ncbi:hypothetical protein GCM10027053_20900 [Intrasporangium mesophilum]
MRHRMLVISLAVAAVCSLAMWLLPGSETVPYHIAWATFALCFGLETWSRRATWLTLGLYTLVSGSILVARASSGVLDWQETAEIPLMLLLVMLMVWHVRRRQSALAAATVLARRERADARARELLTARTAHEMRSPLTIARGYLEATTARPLDPAIASDLAVIDEELTRLTRVCERLVRSMRVTADLENSEVNVRAVLQQSKERWAMVAERDWRVDSYGGMIWGSAERLRAALDTLIENAVRYTSEGDVIELYSRRVGPDLIAVGVADSGPGFAADVWASVTDRGDDAPDAGSPPGEPVRDELSQTGLGLSLVRAIATRRGGRVEFGTSPTGGADVRLVVPIEPGPGPYEHLTDDRADSPAYTVPERMHWWSHVSAHAVPEPQTTGSRQT